ncbi:MAG: adenylate/guanylate cyclase domain-containing protein, partial [Rhizobiaceae bacterium]
MKLRLEVNLASVFTLITLCMLTIVVYYFYSSNRDLALLTARKEMQQARERSVADIIGTMAKSGQVVKAGASLISKFPEKSRSLEALDVMNTLIDGDSQYYGIYFGLENGGTFYQNVVLPPEIQKFGPNDSPVPRGVKRVLSVIDGELEISAQDYYWVSQSGQRIKFAEATTNFDPRKRPWYLGAMKQDGVFVTQLYRFESTGRPGITFAQKIVDQYGNAIGVAGADITMTALAGILEDIRIGDEGLVFLLNREDQLISYTNTRSSQKRSRFLTPRAGQEARIDNSVVAAAMSHWTNNRQEFFRFSVAGDQQNYIASVAPIPEMFGAKPLLGFAVPEDEFVGAIKSTTRDVLKISAIVLLIAILITVLVARLLSNKLRKLAGEARRIRGFDLESGPPLQSSIREISDLSQAMASMKSGLRSFGAYVPTDLVRSIISTGEEVKVGGVSRDVTIMFSDLTSFTSRTEDLEPEKLMPALSHYFEVMEAQITAHGGTVDKYIGDAIMALWNAPAEDDNHCEHACRAVLACRHAEAKINASDTSSPLVPLNTRFGLHRDEVVVGNVGSQSRMQYTVLGAAVNLASRVESLGKVYGLNALVTEQVVERTSHLFRFREIDRVSPAGTTKPVRLYELLGELDPKGTFPVDENLQAEAEAWQDCYELYCDRKWNDAHDAFKQHLHLASSQTLVDLYIQRCTAFM